jgi:energy-coupling factor transport system substrate-specific component
MQERKTHTGKIGLILTIVGFVVILAFSISESGDYIIPISFALMMLSMIPFYIKFEKKELNAEEMVLIAMISALAAVGRVPFAALPSIQPTSFIIIMAAMTFGNEVGFLAGNTAALVSNLFLGQGPWTPWQMFCWGMMGFTAGLLKDTHFMKSKPVLCLFGFVWGFLFGWIMNLWFLFLFQMKDITWKVLLGSCIASFKFDLNHAVCNIIFILLFSDRFTKILNRTKEKYGLLK